MRWKDVTIDKTICESRISLGVITINVHRHIACNKSTWLLTAQPFFVDRDLVSKELEDAKREALFMMREILQMLLDNLK